MCDKMNLYNIILAEISFYYSIVFIKLYTVCTMYNGLYSLQCAVQCGTFYNVLCTVHCIVYCTMDYNRQCVH